jgi:hypothetical protein
VGLRMPLTEKKHVRDGKKIEPGLEQTKSKEGTVG